MAKNNHRDDEKAKTFDGRHPLLILSKVLSGQADTKYNKNHSRFKYYSYLIIFCKLTFLCLLIYNMVYDLKTRNFNELIRKISICLFIVAALFRIVTSSKFDKELHDMKAAINADYEKGGHFEDTQCHIMNKLAASDKRVALKVTLTSMNAAISLPLSWAAKTLYEAFTNNYKKIFMFEFKIPIFEEYKYWSPFYEVIMLYSFLILSINVLTAIDFDSTMLITVNHYSHWTDILNHRLLNLFRSQDPRAYDPLLTKRRLVNVVQLHNHILSQFKMIQNIYYPYLYLIFTLSAVEICVLMYQLTTELSAGRFEYEFLAMLITLTIMVHAMASSGDNVTRKCESVASAAYHSGWEDWPDPAARRSLHLLMLRTMRPTTLRTIFADINLTAFSAIVNSGWSYFTLLRSSGD